MASPKKTQDTGNCNAQKAISALLCLAVLYTLYFASTLLIPLVLAALLSLPLYPVVHFLRRFYIPRAVSGVLLLIALGVPFTLLGMELAEPAKRWFDRIPELTLKVNENIDRITEALTPGADSSALTSAKKAEEPSALNQFFNWFGDEEPEEQTLATSQTTNSELSRQLGLRGLQLFLDIVGEMPVLLAQFVAVIILVLFFLVYGPGIYYAAIEVLPQVRDKSVAKALVVETQRELSRYIFTVSVINLGLGLTTAAALWLLQFEDPLFWGAVVGLLNFAPYVGPVISATVIAAAGLDQYGFAWVSLVPAGVYFAINALESQVVTPVALGRTVSLNPLLTMIWLMLWGWIWGAAGVLIAVPLLVCIKLVLSRLGLLTAWIKVLEARLDTGD